MPWDLCCAVGAVVAPEPCIFLFDGGTVVTYAFVGQSYGAVAAGAVTNRRGVVACSSRSGCCAGVACCSTCCATGACCACACCVVCASRCCAAAWLRFLCSQGTFFCCIGSGIVDSSGRTTTARGCATPTHWFLINDARTNCSRSRNRKRLSWLIHPKNNICHCHVWPHKHVLISLLPTVDHCRKQQTSYWLFDSLPLAWPPWHKCWQTS